MKSTCNARTVDARSISTDASDTILACDIQSLGELLYHNILPSLARHQSYESRKPKAESMSHNNTDHLPGGRTL